MGDKSYLKNQVYLLGLSSYDLFTDAEFDAYMKIVEAKNELDRMDAQEEKDDAVKKRWIEQKKQAQAELAELIRQHAGIPRQVRLKNIIYYPKDADVPFPAGVTWKNLKFSKKISEFSSELTRAMGLNHMDYTFDQIVVKWKSLDVMRQIVVDGICLELLRPDGTVENRHYHFMTASAGQLRRDKVVMISDIMWDKIRERIECGLTDDTINNKKGINVN